MDFLKWYRNKVESNELFPPESVWENIENDLDIDNSWKEINSRLGRRTGLMNTLKAAAAAAVLILALTGVYRHLLTQEQAGENTMLAEDRPDESPAGQKEETQHDVRGGQLPEEQPGIRQTGKEQAAGTQQQDEGGRPARVKEMSGEGSDKKQAVTLTAAWEYVAAAEPKEAAGIPAMNSQVRTDRQIVFDKEEYPGTGRGEKIKKAFKKFYIGSTGQLANTWLVNQKTISGFKSTSLVSTNPSFGSDFGIYAGTGLTDHIDLQMDLNLLARNKQEYNEYINGDYVTNDMQLNYTRLGLSLRYFIVSGNFMQGEHAINLGPYVAYLHNASQNIGSEKIYITGNYNDLDYGLLAGYEYVFPLSGSLGMGTGFRAYYGLNNIYAGNNLIPDYLNATNNASVNITLSFKYLISK